MAAQNGEAMLWTQKNRLKLVAVCPPGNIGLAIPVTDFAVTGVAYPKYNNFVNIFYFTIIPTLCYSGNC